MPKAEKYTIEFLGKKQLSEEIFEFHFSKPAKFRFKPGQYLKMYLDIKNPDSRGSSRYFTISSSPLSDYLSVTTRIVRSVFKKTLANLQKGDRILIFAPIGYFDLDLKSKKNKIFLAGGIGVTPYHSILKSLKDSKLNFEIFLFASFPTKEDAVYLEEFKDIESQNKKINVIYTFTKEKIIGFESGRIDLRMIKKYMPKILDAQFYVVGSESMERNFIKMLKDSRVTEENIFSENFPGY